MQMQKVISSCERCIQHEGAQVKAPLQAILVTSPLELLHVDFTGIEMTIELDQPSHVVNVLVFCDHFMRLQIRLQKLLLDFCGKDGSWSSEHQPSSWVTKGQKADWAKHLLDLVHAYNSTRLAIMGYSPHYLMFGCNHTYPLTFIILLLWAQKNTSVSTTMLLTYVSHCTKLQGSTSAVPICGWKAEVILWS